MEENKSKHKKKSRLNLTVGDGGGIGGVVLLGGGLAVVGLMAAFTIIKNRNRKKDGKNEEPTTPSSKKQDGSQGLSFVFQSPSTIVHQNSCCTSQETSKFAITVNEIDSCELVSIHNFPWGDKTVPIIDGEEENPGSCYQEILISDDYSNQESIASCDEILSAEEASLPVPDCPSLDTPGNMINDDSCGNLQLMETIEEKKEDELVEAGKWAVEENSTMQSVDDDEEEEEENHDDSTAEQVIEKEEESSEGKLAVEENLPMQSAVEKANDDVKEEEELLEMENLAVEEKLPIQSGEEEEDDDDKSEEEHATEKGEESSEEKLSGEENSPIQSTEEEDDYDDNDDSSIEENVTEKEEESSDGTGCSSIESNIEAIWPAEMIEAFSHALKEVNVSKQNLGEKKAKTVNHDSLDCKRGGNIINEDVSNDETTENSTTVLHQKTAQELVRVNAQTVYLPLPKGRIWVLSMLVVVLPMLILHIYRAAMLRDLSYHDPLMVP